MPRSFICILKILLLYIKIKINLKYNTREKKKIKDLAKGEYFILNPIEEPNASQVWVRGEYIREAKKYSTYKWEDTNHETPRKGDKEVYIGFTF